MAGEELPYGIVNRPVYYKCMRCGGLVEKSELERLPNIMCIHCGYRILVKVRPPSIYRQLRKVYAI